MIIEKAANKIRSTKELLKIKVNIINMGMNWKNISIEQSTKHRNIGHFINKFNM